MFLMHLVCLYLCVNWVHTLRCIFSIFILSPVSVGNFTSIIPDGLSSFLILSAAQNPRIYDIYFLRPLKKDKLLNFFDKI